MAVILTAVLVLLAGLSLWLVGLAWARKELEKTGHDDPDQGPDR